MKYAVLTNLWLLAQMWQPGRSIYKDFNRSTFCDYLDTLLDREMFIFYKEVEGPPLIAPRWFSCLSCELEIRKEAVRLCKEESCGVQYALWSTLKNSEHRMKHWLQLVAIPNSASSSSNSEMQALKKRGSPILERFGHETDVAVKWSLDACTSLRLPRLLKVRKEAKEATKSKGKGKSGSSSKAPSTTKDFAYLMNLPVNFRSSFHERFHKREICFPFQNGTCENGTSCKFAHICVSCGGFKPYDECKCLTNKTP